jgi:hypothetical protein
MNPVIEQETLLEWISQTPEFFVKQLRDHHAKHQAGLLVEIPVENPSFMGLKLEDNEAAMDTMPIWKAVAFHHMQASIVALALELEDGVFDWGYLSTMRNTPEEAIFLTMLFTIGKVEYLEKAFEHGFSPNPAMESRDIEVFEPLINNVIKKEMYTPFVHTALQSVNIPMLDSLLKKLNDINIADSMGNTLLHHAAIMFVASPEGDFPLLNLLVAHGIDKELKNQDGKTAFDLVSDIGNKQSEIKSHMLFQKLLSQLEVPKSIILLSP